MPSSAGVKEVKIVVGLRNVVAGTSTQKLTVDMLGFDEVTFILNGGATWATGMTLAAQHGDVSDGSDAADPAAGAISAATAALSQSVAVTMTKPLHRYATATVARAGSSSIDNVVAILSKASHVPITLDSSITAVSYGVDS